jgi:putative SOS response-associated peptidase YedK
VGGPGNAQHVFGIAGLYERWLGPGGEVLDSCTLVTTEPNSLMRRFHDRMPAILDRAAYSTWLDRAVEEPADVLPLLRPCPDDWLEPRAVSSWVNDPKHDDARCHEPVPEPLSLFDDF